MAILQILGPVALRLLVREPAAPPLLRHPQPAHIAARVHPASGEFEYNALPLHEPPDFLPDTSRSLGGPRWYFGNCSRDQLAAFTDTFPVSSEYRAALVDPSRWELSGSGIWLSPPPEMVLKLNAATRSRLYSILANYPENAAQCNPFRFRLDGFNDWFADSGLGAEQLVTLRGLIYTNGGTLCFCDGAIVQSLFSTNDFKRLVRALYGESTFLMRVRVTPESDIDAIVAYWAKGRPAAAIRPLLEALAKVPGGGSVNISYLLPPFARSHLYTYANPAADPTATRQNCFWTAMNFFNEKSDPQFLNFENTRRVLQTDYFTTTEPPTYGDLIVLVDSAGYPIHMCVYLADDVVFTKNGSDYMQPWVLMKTADMMHYYMARGSARRMVYRKKA